MVDGFEPDPLESAFQDAFREVASPRPGDAALLDDLVGNAVTNVIGAGAAGAGTAGSGAGGAGGAGGAAGAGAAAGAAAGGGIPLWIVGTGLGAVLLVGGVVARSVSRRDTPKRPQVEAVATANSEPARERETAPPAADQQPPEEPVLVADTADIEDPPPAPVPVAEPKADTGRGVAKPASVSAADLLSKANAHRRAGEFQKAHDRYRQLDKEHPKSREAVLARVTHGKLLLDRLDRPKDALAQFDAYLEAKPKGTLAEEALAGRARAYRAMDRGAQELAAWRDLLDAYPDGVHAQAAKTRLGESD